MDGAARFVICFSIDQDEVKTAQMPRLGKRYLDAVQPIAFLSVIATADNSSVGDLKGILKRPVFVGGEQGWGF